MIGRHYPASLYTEGPPDARRAACWRATPFRERLNSSGLRLRCSGGVLAKTRPLPAFDRAGEILIADLCDCARDLRFRGFGQFNDGQAGGGEHEAEQAECI